MVLGSRAQIVFIVLDAFFRVKLLFDGGDITLRKESLAGLLNRHDTIEYILLQHEIFYALLVMDKVEILSHKISLVIIVLNLIPFSTIAQVCGTPLVPAATGLLEAAHKLRGFSPGQLC